MSRIQFGIGKDLLGRMDPLQQGVATQNTKHHQYPAQHRAGKNGGIDRSFHLAIAFGAKKLGNNHRTANVAAKGEGDKDQRHLIAVSHGGQGVFTDKFSRHQAVCNVIELLKNDAAKQRQTKLPKNRFWFSYCKILIHWTDTFPPPFRMLPHREDNLAF